MAQSNDLTVRRGLYLAPFDQLADPLVLVELAVAAEAREWDGVFLWDHIVYRDPVKAVLDPWVALAAIATRTRRLRLGPLVTPLSRRRVQKVARETVTLDHLSGGRTIFGVGLGSSHELAQFGEVEDPRERARRLDQGLARLTEFWDGEFEPRPLQRPRIPVWVAAVWPHRRPVRRAMRWDGLFPIELPGPEALAELAGEIERGRDGGLTGFDLVVEVEPDEDIRPWQEAGATWALSAFGRQPQLSEVRATIDAGPR